MKFRAELELHGKTSTGFVVPEEVVTGLGTSKKPAVKVTINAQSYRSSIAFMGGRFLLGVSAENRALTGISAGDVVDVDVELDTEPRVITVPDDFQVALNANPVALERFNAMSYSHKRRWVESIEGAKAADTRARRIAKSVTDIETGK